MEMGFSGPKFFFAILLELAAKVKPEDAVSNAAQGEFRVDMRYEFFTIESGSY